MKVIIGLGKTGISCVRYLAKQGYNLAVVDSRYDPPGLQEMQQNFLHIPLYLGSFTQKVLLDAEELIISPGVSVATPVIASCLQRGTKVIGDIELFVRATQTPIIAITGSNGKSTVTTLVGAMLQATGKKIGIGGNLGIPALELLNTAHDYYVLELSSFQLENTYSLQATAATILNLSQDHMDRHPNFNAYLAAKQRIYNNCHTAIVNRDEPLTYTNINLPHKVLGFSSHQPAPKDFGIHNGYLMHGTQQLLSINELKIKGIHNATNALAALALGTAVAIPEAIMRTTLTTFTGLPHRCQWVAQINGVEWYNDSKGTNVGATLAAISGLGSTLTGKIILLAGGTGKGADFSLLRPCINNYVRTIVLIGQDAKVIAQTLAGSCKIIYATSMAEAVTLCDREALPGDSVLLSPACASLDMFKNFENRGEVFTHEVNKLKT